MRNVLQVNCMYVYRGVCPTRKRSKQGQKFTLEDFNLTYTFRTQGVSGLRSLNDGEHYTVLEDKGKKLVMYSYKTGKAVSTLLDLNDPKYKAVQTIQDYEFSPEEDRILICTNINPIYRRSFTADYFVFDFKNKELKPLSEGGSQRLATFSPTGTKVAFCDETTTSLLRTYVFGHEFRSPLTVNLMKSLTEPPTGYMKRNSDSTKPSSGLPTDRPRIHQI